MQDDDIPGIVRFRTYEVLKEEVNNPRLRWAYLPYSMHMAGPREAIQHMIIRRNYGTCHSPTCQKNIKKMSLLDHNLQQNSAARWPCVVIERSGADFILFQKTTPNWMLQNLTA